MSTKKLGRVMWTHSACGDELVLRHTNPPGYNRKPVVVINLSDPAGESIDALVEKVAKEYVGPATWKAMGPTAQYLVCEDIVDMLRALGIPAKSLKERKKK